ncbi:hypothetical protein E8L99_13120 [Phreatobacter aquaticus]|uniref:Uncharacterized protein n=1 Tax=Phreatobacter aquaticus TaxID=2570229 RepID=A0A4D7QJ08_9HYPH|nr:hypothetical protein [Phreatobacter aquaticus]QCK86631.1 hypothetical protein E8L99_13120 [Phreatobacter aquaticus]
MTPIVTVSYGGLSAATRVPSWTHPFLVRIAERIVTAASANDPAPGLRVVETDTSVRVVDEAPGAFGREFGTLNREAKPRLGPAVRLVRAGGA